MPANEELLKEFQDILKDQIQTYEDDKTKKKAKEFLSEKPNYHVLLNIYKEISGKKFLGAGARLTPFVSQMGDNFEMFVDGEPVSFKYTRTKEVVAILVNNRGAQTSNGEIIANLWEDDGDPMKKTSYLSNLRQDLQNTLTRLKLNGIILKQRGSMAIAADKVECDLFDWLAKKKDSKYQYTGDYMNQYTWPEYYHAELDEISYAMDDE